MGQDQHDRGILTAIKRYEGSLRKLDQYILQKLHGVSNKLKLFGEFVKVFLHPCKNVGLGIELGWHAFGEKLIIDFYCIEYLYSADDGIIMVEGLISDGFWVGLELLCSVMREI